jgi:hypothetical protein
MSEIDYSNYKFKDVKFDREEINDRHSWFGETQELFFKKVMKQIEDLIASKVKEKGYGHLIEGIEKRKFPKLCMIKQYEWTYVYADNDTDEGAFIVAFKEEFNNDFTSKDFTTKMTVNLKWQDNQPLIND